MSFNDKVVWITGASSGYGAALARAFSQAGARLVLSARREAELAALAKELGNAVALPLDLADFGAFEEKTKQAVAAYGHVDFIVHNGALAQNAPALQTSLNVERQLMDVDYFSYTELTRCILPHMLERGSGHIVVVSGLLAHINLPGRSTYAAAKAALIAYFGCLRAELLHSDIHVTVLIPGAMQTGLASKAIKADGQPAMASSDEVLSTAGCPLNEAADQTLRAIAEGKMQTYIGLEDPSHQLWMLTLNDPEQGIRMLLERFKKNSG